MTEAVDDIAALLPDVREVTANGETLKISPFLFTQVLKAGKVIKPLFGAIRSCGFYVPIGDRMVLSPDWQLLIPDLVAEAGDGVVELLLIQTGKSRQWLDQLSQPEGVVLTRTMFEVNVSFFSRETMPLLSDLLAAKPQTSDGVPSSAG